MCTHDVAMIMQRNSQIGCIEFLLQKTIWKVSLYIPNIEMSGNKLDKLYK